MHVRQLGYVAVAWVVRLLCVLPGIELVQPGELQDGMNGIDAMLAVSSCCVGSMGELTGIADD